MGYMKDDNCIVGISPPYYLELKAEDILDILDIEYITGYDDCLEDENTLYLNFEDEGDLIHFLYHCVKLNLDCDKVDFSEFKIDFFNGQLNHIYLSEINAILSSRIDFIETSFDKLVDQTNQLTDVVESLLAEMNVNGIDRFKDIMSVLVSRLEDNGISVRDDINNHCRYSLH